MESNQMKTITCKYCGKEFEAPTASYKYCSQTCKRKFWNENPRAKAKPKPRKKILECEVCGKLFEGLEGQRYCGKQCINKTKIGSKCVTTYIDPEILRERYKTEPKEIFKGMSTRPAKTEGKMTQKEKYIVINNYFYNFQKTSSARTLTRQQQRLRGELGL